MDKENYKNLNSELVIKVQNQKIQIRDLENLVVSERKQFSEENKLLKQTLKNLQNNVVTFLGRNYTEFLKIVYPDEDSPGVNNLNIEYDSSRRSSSSIVDNGRRSKRRSTKLLLSNNNSLRNDYSPRKPRSIENLQNVPKMRSESCKTFSESRDSENIIYLNNNNDENQDLYEDLHNISNENEINNHNGYLSNINEENETSSEGTKTSDKIESDNANKSQTRFNGYESGSPSKIEDTLSDTTIKNLLDAPCSTPYKPIESLLSFPKALKVRIKKFDIYKYKSNREAASVDNLEVVNETDSTLMANKSNSTLRRNTTDFGISKVLKVRIDNNNTEVDETDSTLMMNKTDSTLTKDKNNSTLRKKKDRTNSTLPKKNNRTDSTLRKKNNRTDFTHTMNTTDVTLTMNKTDSTLAINKTHSTLSTRNRTELHDFPLSHSEDSSPAELVPNSLQKQTKRKQSKPVETSEPTSIRGRGRPKRSATPTNLKERSLTVKLRRQ